MGFKRIDSGLNIVGSIEIVVSKFYLSLVAVIILFSSCTKNLDDFGPQSNEGETPIAQSKRVVVLNEGNFMFGNGSISVIDNTTDEVSYEAFKQANNYPLGDVPQSVMVHDSLGYIVVNNSGKIEVVEWVDFKSVKTITGFTSPRQMTVVSQNPLTAWVTDLYANKIWKVDLESGTIIGDVPSQGWNENIVKWNDNVLVLNKKDSVINVFNHTTEQLSLSIGAGLELVDFKWWSANELMVLANTGLYRLEMQTMNLVLVKAFIVKRTPIRLAVDTTLNISYFLDVELFRYETNIDQVVTSNLGSNLYGLTVNSVTHEVYVTDTKDFVQPGLVLKYSSDFQDSVAYEVGINPQYLVLE
jgi:hypothetical protein